MAIIKTDDQHYKDMASELRTLMGTERTYKPNEMSAAMSDANEEVNSQADLVQSITTAIHGKTGISGYDAGVADGKQAEYDRFWDDFQENGSRVGYFSAFAGRGWTEETFKPKYSINPTTMLDMFNSAIRMSKVDCAINTANCTTFQRAFAYCGILQYVPQLDLSNCQSFIQTFMNCYALKSLSLVNIPATCEFSGAFNDCSSLTEVTLAGTVGQDISFKWSPLNKESIESVITSLSDTTTDKTATINEAAVDEAFETSEGLADGGTSEEWLALVASKPNWTITLA